MLILNPKRHFATTYTNAPKIISIVVKKNFLQKEVTYIMILDMIELIEGLKRKH